MRRALVGLALYGILIALCSVAEGQQTARIPRIGYLTGPALSISRERHEAFRDGLRELGYVEGKNIVIEWRAWEGKQDRQRTLAAELVGLKVDVIVTVGAGDTRAVKEATATIPIIMINGGDPVASGFVASLARPGGNITGFATLRRELSGKRLELLKEIVPKLSRVAVFESGGDWALVLKEVDDAAVALGVNVQRLSIRSARDFETAFKDALKGRAEAVLMLLSGPLLTPHRTEVTTLAIKNRLPAMYERAIEVEAGGLVSYGLNFPDLHRRAATYVDKILKGANPAELPVEQPTKFELVINLQTAKQIGLAIPANVLARADRVIK
jgi:putative ABC transport system substrate-binding protein